MSDRFLRAPLVALCITGAAIASYLLSARFGSTDLICSTGGCETVQSSSYAEILGFPVAAAGLVGYLLIGVTVLVDRPLARPFGAALALGAVVFGGYLLAIQLTVLNAVCDWCLASDAISGGIAVLALLRLRGSPAPEEQILAGTA